MSNPVRFCLRVYTQARLGVSSPSDVYYPLSQGKWIIGSDPGSWLYLNEPYVLPQHLEIECSSEGCQVTYLGAEDGVGAFLDDAQTSLPTGIALPFALQKEIRLGFTRLILEELQEEAVESVEISAAVPSSAIFKPLRPYQGEFPPGLHRLSTRFLQQLPEIYQPGLVQPTSTGSATADEMVAETFLSRFLALFESVFLPMEWMVSNFDFYLDVATVPELFVPWLQQWYALTFDQTWSNAQRDKLLRNAHQLFALRGSKWSLTFILETYLGGNVEIEESESLGAHAFRVKLQGGRTDLAKEEVQQLINAFKPAHTICELQWV